MSSTFRPLTESQRCNQGALFNGLEIRHHVTTGCSPHLHHCVLSAAQSEDLPQACRVSLQVHLALQFNYELSRQKQIPSEKKSFIKIFLLLVHPLEELVYFYLIS